MGMQYKCASWGASIRSAVEMTEGLQLQDLTTADGRKNLGINIH